MNLCPTCKTSFSGGEQFCPRDGTPLRASLPEDPLAGRVLSGRYRLIEVIGRGGMGAVYRAHHILMDKPVAVKVLRQELASDTEAVARFHREARSASRLDHENIIRVSDFGQTDDGLLFLVMELLDGENLAQVLRRGALPWRRAVAISRDMALGLAHAHEQGVIHRDLKPENIILTRRGKTRQGVKVLDFGLAKLVQRSPSPGLAFMDGAASETGEPDVAIQSLTRTGVVFGTPEYMSPEQAEGRPLDARTDIYALGVVTYQMVSGNLPFSAPTFLALIAKTVNEPPPPLRTVGDGGVSLALPSELEELVLRCLAKSPEDRPQTADEIADELAELLSRFPEEPSRSGEVPITPASGGLPGGVKRTVQRHLPPGQSPRTAPRDSGAVVPSPSAPESGPQRRSSKKELRKSGAAGFTLKKTLEPPPEREPELLEEAVSAVSSEAEPDGAQAAASAFSAPAGLGSAAAESAEAEHAPKEELGEQEGTLKVPRRPYWVAIAVLLCVGAVVYLTQFYPNEPTKVAPAAEPGREQLRRARELLFSDSPGQAQVEEALRILRDEREMHNTPEVHRLLSRAYEVENNRLRALGHLYTAVRLGGTGAESRRSQLALSQLLSRLGHLSDACQTAAKVLSGHGAVEPEVRHQAEELLSTLHCPPHN